MKEKRPSPVMRLLQWAGPERKWLILSVLCAFGCSKSLYAAINCHHLDQPHLHPNQPEPRPKPCDTAVLPVGWMLVSIC